MHCYVHGIMNCTFACNKFEETVRFYRDTLEMEHVYTIRDENGCPLKTCLRIADRQFLILLNEPYRKSRGWNNLSCTHIAILVEDIFQFAKEMESKNVLLTKGPSVNRKYLRVPYVCDPEIAPCGSYTAWVQDPEGNEVEFMQYTKASMQISCYPN